MNAYTDWLAVDPDPATRAELEGLLAGEDRAGLEERFSGHLVFGTAGLRGPLRAGPSGMNRVVVRQAAYGLMSYLGDGASVVVGHDARTNSDVFAADTADIVASRGGEAFMLPPEVPTPVLAYAIRHLGVDAGVMVTASHNPPQDNGYKVYLADGVQIIPPADHDIEAAIVAGGMPPIDTPRGTGRITHVGDEIVEAYIAGLPRPEGPPVTVAYTPMHGVGWETLRRGFAAAGLPEPAVVAAQAAPDPAFPTVPFPNPEEPGAMDLVRALGEEIGADVVLANDPDADRLAVAVPERTLTGDEVGVLLGDYVLRTTDGPGRVMANSMVSSRMLGRLAEAAGIVHKTTLTGFKWVARAADDVPGGRFVFGYEEALGYCVGDWVRDKDGISAALAFVGLVQSLKAEGRTVLDRLDELGDLHGRHLTGHVTVRTDAAARMREVRGRLPTELAGVPVERTVDRLEGGELPPADMLELYLADGSRVCLRPSGTEPKLKGYLEVVDQDRAALDRLGAAVEALVG